MRAGARAVVVALLVAAVGCSSYYRPRPGRRISIIMHEGSVAYTRDGRVFPMGIAGGGLVDAVAGNPAAEEAAETFNNRMIAGWVMLGLAIVGTGWFVYRVEEHNDVDDVDGIIVGGILGLELGALIAIISAQPYHYDAINIYNDTVAP